MEIFNDTGLAFAMLPGRLEFPAHSLTLIVKGTFNLSPTGPATLASGNEILLPTGDTPYGDDDEGTGSVFYESDFAHYKPKADLLLVGSCHPPGGQATTCPAQISVGKHSKSLEVFGERRHSAKPAPFAKMELRYEKAALSKHNPVGKRDKANVEDRRHPHAPAGFGPIARTWRSRHDKVGTYKGGYLAKRWPWLPTDFDWSHCNAAPDDQQVPYLHGDETLQLLNLHPQHAVYRSQLPGLRVRCFVNKPEAFTEPEMRLDTLWIDAEEEVLVLVWRGAVEVASEDLEDVSHLFVLSDPLTEPRRPIEECKALFEQRLIAPDEIDAEEPPVAEEDPAAAEEAAAELAALSAVADRVAQKFAEDGVDGENLPQPSDADQAAQAEKLAAWGLVLPEATPALSREEVIARHGRGESLAGEQLAGLDLSGLDLCGADLVGANLSGVNLDGALLRELAGAGCLLVGASLRQADLGEADLSAADLSEAVLDQAKLGGARLSDALMKAAHLSGAELTGATLERAVLSEAILDTAKLGGADLSQADVTGASLRGADLSAAIITGAICDNANLEEAVLEKIQGQGCHLVEVRATGARLKAADLGAADLGRATLDRADLTDAVMADAAIEGASLREAVLNGADLSNLRASEGCDLWRATLHRVKASGSNWSDGKLQEAELTAGDFSGALFNQALLDAAVMVGADCREAQFRKASLRGAKLSVANLFKAILERADLRLAELLGANCYGAEFLDAQLEGAKLRDANLKMTKLAGHRDF